MTAVLLPNRGSLWAALFLALACAALGLTLAAHHPLAGGLAVVAWLAAALAAARFWPQTPLLLALLPLLGLAPWSGWISLEELDLLVLACAAGGYASVALRLLPQTRAPAWRHTLAFSPLVLLLLSLFGLSVLIAVGLGLSDAGGLDWGLFQGYHEPMNSLRAGKSFFLALLLWPLWVHAGACRPRELVRSLVLGLCLGLGGAGLAVLWERAANTGLLDFATEYRSSALFWEMHVGGAALEGFLALSLPMSVLALLRVRRPWQFSLALGLVLLGIYACLTSFSRGVYVALPLSLALLLVLRSVQRRRTERGPGRAKAPLLPQASQAKLGALLIAGSFGLAALWMFDAASTRGLLALLGIMLSLLLMPASLWLPSTAQRVTAVLMGGLLALLLAALSWVLIKALPEQFRAAYAAYVLAFAANLALRARHKPGQAQPVYLCLAAAAWFWLLSCLVFVADSWGGPPARLNAMGSTLLMGSVWSLTLLWPALWPLRGTAAADGPGWRSRSLLFGGVLLVAALVMMLGGSAGWRERLSNWPEDLQARLNHWQQGLDMLATPQDWLLGKGAGRFVANHFYVGPGTQHTGDYRLKTEAAPPQLHYLLLTGGKRMLGDGELFRISQRIAAPQGELTLEARLRAADHVALRAEVCEKHLLYSSNCLSQRLEIKAQPGAWQRLSVPLGTAPALGGAWYAPRLISFSVAVESTGGRVDIGELQLRDGRGPLLRNSDFSGEMAHWFFSSDRYHLPWHLKNLGLHVLFEQGLVGVALLGVLLLLALWRLIAGRGREHPLAPALAASLLGFVLLGVFDSLIDAPRIAFLFYVLLLFSLGLRALPGAAAAEPSK